MARRARDIRNREEMKAPPAEADETGMTTFVEKESEDDGSPPGRGRNRGGGRPSGGTSGSSRPGTRPASTPTRAGPAPSLRSTFRTASAGPRPTTGSPSTTASATSAGTTRSTWSGTQSSRSGGRPPTPQRAKADALHLRPVAAFRRAKEEAAGRGGAFQDPHQEKGAAPRGRGRRHRRGGGRRREGMQEPAGCAGSSHYRPRRSRRGAGRPGPAAGRGQ